MQEKATLSIVAVFGLLLISQAVFADVAVENYNARTAIGAGDTAVVDLPDTASRFTILATAADLHFSTAGEADGSSYIIQENKDWVASYSVDKLYFYADAACTAYVRSYQLKR